MVTVYAKHFDCFIHIDKKAEGDTAFLQFAKQFDNVFIIKKYKINWGSYRHMDAFLCLLHCTVEKGPYDYYHLISENTFLCCSFSAFDTLFKKQKSCNFIDVKAVEDDNIANRYRYRHYLHIYNMETTFGKKCEWMLYQVQKVLHLKTKRHYAYIRYVSCHLTHDLCFTF